MNRIIDDTPACNPIERILKILESKGFVITEERLEDYHFAQLYFKVVGNIDLIDRMDLKGFIRKDNFLICECHWSAIEFLPITKS
jgi:hypothetical protein